MTPLSDALANSYLASCDLGIAEDFLGQRTLLDIIWSCFVTIFACTWVIVHPNIPSEADSEWRIIGRRLKIMVYTLLVPELVLYWASKQWYAAREVARKHSARGWTKTHGFFIGMGGFVLYKSGEAIRLLDLTDLGDLFELGELDWPTISEEDIMDKSKGDYFTKSVVLIQTTWFVVQCIARGVLGLGLTELELVTLAFAALSVAMYFFWWHKPLDVRRPIPIHATRTATMQFSVPYDEETLRELETRLSYEDEVDSTSINLKGPVWETAYIPRGRGSTLRRARSLSSFGAPSGYMFNGEVDINFPRDITSASSFVSPFKPTSSFTNAPSYLGDSIYHSYSSRKSQAYSRKNVPPPNQAARKYSLYDTFAQPIHTFLDDIQELRYSGEVLSERGESRVSTFYAAMQLNLQHELTILFLTTATVYGCIHCTAWWFIFPSTVERWLWRLSALAVSILPSLFGLQWLLVIKFTARPYNLSTKQLTERLERVFHVTSSPRLLIMLTIYIVARIALLVLPLLSLRALSPGVYVSISWTNVVPHI